MEFKGTKGKWKIDKYNNVSSNYNEIAFLKSDTPNKERRANALLISKAPEMLEMLQKIYAILEDLWHEDESNDIFDLLDAEELDNLIKEATEL